jgi:hypothetical protein
MTTRRSPRAFGALFPLLLALLLSGCLGGTTPSTTTASAPHPEPSALAIPEPTDFHVQGFVPLAGDDRPQVVAFGLGGVSLPFVGFYDFERHAWETQQVSMLPFSLGRAGYGVSLGEPGAFALALGIADKAQGISYTDWITHDAQGWHVEDRPARWAMHGPGGVVRVGGQIFVLASAATPELWRLDASLGWQREPPFRSPCRPRSPATRLPCTCASKTSNPISF